MQIILMCAHESGSVAFHAQFIGGIPAPERRYDIRNYRVVLDNGYAEAILHHDADVLLANPLYRMPSPAEQESFVKAEQGKHEIQEAFIPLGPDVIVVSPVMAARLARIENAIPIATETEDLDLFESAGPYLPYDGAPLQITGTDQNGQVVTETINPSNGISYSQNTYSAVGTPPAKRKYTKKRG